MAQLPVQFTEESPVCPHCGTALDGILARRMQHDLGKAFVHFCPRCKKVLGISHRKGFWMG